MWSYMSQHCPFIRIFMEEVPWWTTVSNSCATCGHICLNIFQFPSHCWRSHIHTSFIGTKWSKKAVLHFRSKHEKFSKIIYSYPKMSMIDRCQGWYCLYEQSVILRGQSHEKMCGVRLLSNCIYIKRDSVTRFSTDISFSKDSTWAP